jgi:hypothetical protein
MIDITQLLAKEYNINVLNFNLWFRPKFDDHKLIKQFPKDALKTYPHTLTSDKYILENFYTNEYYLLNEIILDTNAGKSYYIVDIYSWQSKKQILTFVTNKYINQDKTKELEYIYFLTIDKLVRIKNTNRFITNLDSISLYYVFNIPFIHYEEENYRAVVYSIFDSKHIKFPYRLYYCKYVLRLFNNNIDTRMLVNPFNFTLYMQIHYNSSYDILCIPSKLLI